jgi:hypothetical protein
MGVRESHWSARLKTLPPNSRADFPDLSKRPATKLASGKTVLRRRILGEDADRVPGDWRMALQMPPEKVHLSAG